MTTSNFLSNEVVSMLPVKLIIQKTNTYNQMYSRPYETNVQHDTLGYLVNKLENSPTINVTPELVSDIAGSVLKPSSLPDGEIHISNGWNTPRDKFVLIVRVIYNSNTEELHYIQGFTDYHCVSDIGHYIDPESNFTINSINRVGVTQGMYVNGFKQDPVRRLLSSDQAISSPMLGQPSFGMRPVDIINAIETGYVSRGLTHTGEVTTTIDTRAFVDSGGASCSKRINNVPSSYLATILTNFNNQYNKLDEFSGDSEVWRNCSLSLSENKVAQNSFVRALSNSANVGISNWFKYKDLLMLFPDIDKVTTYVAMSNQDYSFIHTAGSTEHLHYATRETIAATMLSQAVPSIMTQCMINKIRFRASNSDILGNVNIAIISSESIYVNQNSIALLLDSFKYKFEREVFNTITYNNSEVVNLDMMCDLYGDTCVNISMSGGPMTPFVFPTFCDGLMAPTVSVRQDKVVNVSSDMEAMLRSCGEIIAARKNAAKGSDDTPVENNLVDPSVKIYGNF